MTPTIPETSTSLVLEAFKQPLSIKSTPITTPTPTGTALVRILSTTIRPHSRAGFAGNQVLPFPVPYTPGNSAVARVLDVGADAVSLQPGQLVWVDGFVVARDDPVGTQILLGLSDFGGKKQAKLFKAWPGVWADVAQVPLENCVPLNETILCDQMGYSPADLEYIERLAIANAGVKAAHLAPGQTVVVCPATGHYSGAVAELAAQLGCRVIALTRSVTKLEPLTSRHPRILPVELTGDVARDTAAIRALCPGGGAADALIDMSPGEATANPTHLYSGLASLRNHGRAVFLGALRDVTIPYMSLMVRNINVRGQFMYSRDQLGDVIRLIESGVVKLGREAGHEVVQGGFKLAEWEEAVRVAEEATFWGRQTLFLP
ncbi:Alcohol dehydrogenase-like protein [Hapsidospora chrysogenum ATCC 11550]|uniref:Alcohol dehydrogenase-like protein n=1 Tax=Hapsidospora chrysogenum (strain ATCC 11550 / CBS 779.69 / DSM 880 / IAM 14645 / JCM 23072 / IMI 49137) TaxID=857340 RepID=A0A086SX96_HAPC1|nr:Alcohol dehydrogenase-like protein [Hapsidospora chrysogenum ATCC 11550]